VSPSRGYVFLVADGLGGLPGGQQASGTALRAIADYVTQAMDLYATLEPEKEAGFIEDLVASVRKSHEAVLQEGARGGEPRGMATTLTMVTIRWPRAFLVHVGDSRCYRLHGGQLEQMSRDQTMAQAMVDAGVLDANRAEESRLKHILWSALGSDKVTPDTLVVDIDWDDVMLLCTDGLTKHVTGDEIHSALQSADSAEAVCRRLVGLALDRGGSDNVTVVVARLRAR
jgi:protein phosphatase